MAYTPVKMGQAQVQDTATTIHTVPAVTTALLRDMMICNVDSSAHTITVYLDPDGTTASDATAILDAFSIPANDFRHWSGYQVLEAAATLKAVADTSNVITITAAGIHVT